MKTAALSISLVTLHDGSSRTLSKKVNSDLQNLGYQSQCWEVRSLYGNTQLIFDAVVLVVYSIGSLTLPLLDHLVQSGVKKIFIIRKSIQFFADIVHLCEQSFGSEKVVAIDFLEDEYKNCFDQLVASISKR